MRIALMAPYLAVFYPFLALRRASLALRPDRAWRSWVTPNVLVGGFLAPRDVVALARDGVGAVVNVSHELLDPREALAAAGISYLRVPCWDTRPPELEDAVRGVRRIAEHVAAGQKVYIHCASGVGRSVTLSLCYLAAHEGMSVEEATATVRKARPWIAMSPAQRAFVETYVGWHRSNAASATPDR